MIVPGFYRHSVSEHYGRQVIFEAVLPSDISVFHMQVKHVNHKKDVFEKIMNLQSAILNVDFLLQLFNSALSASVFYT